MSPTPNAAAALPMRQSCDRCHKQKLRCARTGNSNTGACDRCLRKRAQCVYSSSLPKGRPSLYNSADAHSSTKVEPNPMVNVYPSPSDDSSQSQSKPSESNSIMHTDPWPWVQSLNVDDSQIDWGDQDSGQSMFNWHAMINPAQIEITTSCITAFPVLFDRDIAGRDGRGDSHEQKPPNPTLGAGIFSQFPGYGNLHGDTSFAGGKNGICFSGGSGFDPDLVLAELAQLSVRLTPLCRSSHHLAKSTEPSQTQGHGHHKPLIDDAAFESVAAWLAHGSVNVNMLAPADCRDPRPCTLPLPETKSTGVMLCHVLSASHHLLKILHYLQANAEPSSSFAVTADSTPLFSPSSESSYFALPKRASMSYPGTPNSCLSNASDDSIRNLVTACHTMLLNIYIAVLVILERDADSRTYRDKSALGDIRLVSVVQLCAYLINRQHHAIELYLSAEGAFHSTPSQDLDLVHIFGAMQSEPSTSDMVTRQAMKDLKMEVQERMCRLQRTLCI